MALDYKINVGMDVHWATAMDWCLASFGGEAEFHTRWDTTPSSFSINFLFKNEEDATLFALKWL